MKEGLSKRQALNMFTTYLDMNFSHIFAVSCLPQYCFIRCVFQFVGLIGSGARIRLEKTVSYLVPNITHEFVYFL